MAKYISLLKRISSKDWRLGEEGMSINNGWIYHTGNRLGYFQTVSNSNLEADMRNIKVDIAYRATSRNVLVVPSVNPTLSEAYAIIRLIPKIVTDPESVYYNPAPYMQSITVPFSQSYMRAYHKNAMALTKVIVPVDTRVGLVDRIEVHAWIEVPCEIPQFQVYFEE